MYVEVTLQDKEGTYKHKEFFPKFHKVHSINRLKQLYGSQLVGYKLLGSKLNKD